MHVTGKFAFLCFLETEITDEAIVFLNFLKFKCVNCWLLLNLFSLA